MTNHYKSIAVIFLLVFCCITVLPIMLLIINACYVGYYDDSVLGRLIDEL